MEITLLDLNKFILVPVQPERLKGGLSAIEKEGGDETNLKQLFSQPLPQTERCFYLAKGQSGDELLQISQKEFVISTKTVRAIYI